MAPQKIINRTASSIHGQQASRRKPAWIGMLVVLALSLGQMVTPVVGAPTVGTLASPANVDPGPQKFFFPVILTARTHAAVVVEGPWSSLPSGAGPGLALDGQSNALTLQSDPSNLELLLQPAPEKDAFSNNVLDLEDLDGRLYIGYGDEVNNRGPVDLLSYDPLSGSLERELSAAPDENTLGWTQLSDGRLLVAGGDALESWDFGNFYLNDGSGWLKRRTIAQASHVIGLAEYKGRLYAAYRGDETPPVDFPFALVSGNLGASWQYERVDQGSVADSNVIAVEPVRHASGEFLYAILTLKTSMPPASSPSGSYTSRLYRFDGAAWERVSLAQAPANFQPGALVPYGDRLLVSGLSGLIPSVYALDGLQDQAVPFLSGKALVSTLCDTREDWLYCIPLSPQAGDPDQPPVLVRTHDGLAWEETGKIQLLTGALPAALAFSHGRLFVGARNAGWMEEGNRLELLPALVRPIFGGTLQWEADVPDGAQLSIQVRTAGDPFSLLSKPWVGPDGTPDTAFTQPGQLLHAQHDGHIFFQAAIFKTANPQGQLPVLPYLSLQSATGRLDQAVDYGQGLYTPNFSAPLQAEVLSRVFDLSEPIQGGQIFFEGNTPGQTSLRFQVRSAQSAQQLDGQPFTGPDGTPGSFYQSSGQPLWEGHSGDVYLQIRILLASADPKQAPFLRKVVLATRTTRLHHFAVSWTGPEGWTAGQPRTVQVSARFGNDHTMPLWGAVSLSARDLESGLPIPIQPEEAILVNGEAAVQVSLPRAARTEICANLAGVSSCSQPVAVHPASPASIAVSTDLPEPHPHWSPVGQAGQPFGLSLEVYDRFHNLITDYAGTVRCERWDHGLVDADLLPPVTFTLADGGRRQLPGSLLIQAAGEWNLVCSDQDKPHLAGAQAVKIEPPRPDKLRR